MSSSGCWSTGQGSPPGRLLGGQSGRYHHDPPHRGDLSGRNHQLRGARRLVGARFPRGHPDPRADLTG